MSGTDPQRLKMSECVSRALTRISTHGGMLSIVLEGEWWTVAFSERTTESEEFQETITAGTDVVAALRDMVEEAEL